jgi:hypothetical protein
MTMNVDPYTKAVLTVIAGALLWLCATSTAQPLQAQPISPQVAPLPAQPVVVVGWGRLNPQAPAGIEIAWSDSNRKISEPAVPIRPAAEGKFNPLRVRLEMAAPLPVSVEGIKKGDTWDPLRTAAEPDVPSRVPGIRKPK